MRASNIYLNISHACFQMADSFRTHRSCCWWCDHRTEKKLQVKVLVSQRWGQLAAGGGLFVAQPATELTVTRYLHFSGSSTCNLLVRLSQSIPVPCKLFGRHAIWNVGANTVNLMRRRRKVSVRKSSMNCWGTSVGVGERGHKMQGERGEKTRGEGGRKATFEILCMLQGSHFTTCLTNKHRDSSNSGGSLRTDMSPISVNPSQITPSHLPDTQSGICSAD